MKTIIGVKVERAKIGDVPQMHRLINLFAARGEMLPRPLSEIYENLRDYLVIRDQRGEVIACGALHICWSDLAEIKAVAVAEEKQHQGLGRLLVEAAIEEAKEIGVATLFCLTYKPEFFESFGFHQVKLSKLPRKVWGECQRCPKFPNCDEIALLLPLRANKKAKSR